jgi:hypothetical protein
MANQQDLVRLNVTDANGRTQARGLPPGDYKVFALEDNDVDTNVAQSADFLTELGGRATPVTVHSGGPDSIDVKIVPADEVRRIRNKLQ